MDTVLSTARERMQKSIEVVKQDLSSVRTGRATSALVEHIVVAAYGGSTRMKLVEMATITASDSRTLVISPYDPSTTEEIEKAIKEANIGINPARDGDILRLTTPDLSEERRKEYLKLAKTKVEHGRVIIRQIRADAMKEIKKLEEEKVITEDMLKSGEKHVQELTDKMIREIDDVGARKEQELMTI